MHTEAAMIMAIGFAIMCILIGYSFVIRAQFDFKSAKEWCKIWHDHVIQLEAEKGDMRMRIERLRKEKRDE